MKSFLVLPIYIVIVFIAAYFAEASLAPQPVAQTKKSYSVSEVRDGDSFITTSGVRIRLLGVDAPELARCNGSEAKAFLQTLIAGKEIRTEKFLEDEFGRDLSYVWLGDTLVNEKMVENGLARLTYSGGSEEEKLQEAVKIAKAEKLGIWSDVCRSSKPSDACVIKANVTDEYTYYYTPGCPNYQQVIVDTAYGDAWFCSEVEAIAKGFTKNPRCEK